ncbi:MAG: hypothetical protein RPR97_10145 [Colwellia sp.]|jgi:hypothetical protein
MKLVKHFNEFLKNNVNLNQNRVDTLERRVATITSFIRASDNFCNSFITAIPQGSYSHRTIIKPTKKKAIFDADVVVYLKSIKGWEPKGYIQKIYELFNSSSVYRGKVSRQTRCVKLNYAGEFHIDIVPCVRESSLWDGDQNNVCNRLTNKFESCSSEKYSDWVKEKNSVVGNNNLIKSIRLFKYLRDHKQTFSVKSILLTTIVASQVTAWDKLWGTDDFKDLPTSLKSLFNRLDNWLQENETMPIVNNPADDDENFNRHWDENKYQNFRSQVSKYNDWINDAYSELDKTKSIEKWQKIFGDCFIKQVAKKQSSSKSLPSHCEPLRWPLSSSTRKLTVKAVVQKQKNSLSIGELSSLDFVPKAHWIRFVVKDALDSGTKIYWQVVNNGAEAIENKCLRGDFFEGNLIHKESTLYKGKHWVEAVAVKNGYCIAKSGPVFVNIM